jgi:hypothetical protein
MRGATRGQFAGVIYLGHALLQNRTAILPRHVRRGEGRVRGLVSLRPLLTILATGRISYGPLSGQRLCSTSVKYEARQDSFDLYCAVGDRRAYRLFQGEKQSIAYNVSRICGGSKPLRLARYLHPARGRRLARRVDPGFCVEAGKNQKIHARRNDAGPDAGRVGAPADRLSSNPPPHVRRYERSLAIRGSMRTRRK